MCIKRVLLVILTLCSLLLMVTPPAPLSAAGREAGHGSRSVNSGGPVSQWFPISPLNPSEGHEWSSAVAYNSWWREYLVVWARDFANGERHIYGQFVSRRGTLIGSPFLISGFTGPCGAPEVAYNPTRNEYLVVYDYSSPVYGYGIYGQRLNASGQALGSPIVFAASVTDQYREPAVAYATVSGAYLVVWQRNQGTVFKGIEARELSGDGTTMGSILEVTGMLAYVEPSSPDVAYVPTRDECLVVWQQWYDSSYSDHDIKGQRIGMAGGAHLITPPGNFVIHYSSYDEIAPAVAAIVRPAGGQYLVVCSYNWTSGGRWITVGQLLSDAGTPGPWLPIGTSDGPPAVAGNDATQEYLVAWPIGVPGGTDLRALTVSTLGDLGPVAQALPPRSSSTLLLPAVASGPSGDYLVTCHDYYQAGYQVDILGFLWGNRVFLPLVLRGH